MHSLASATKHRGERYAQVLGTWYERGKVLIFVQSQDKCDTLFRDLLKVRHPPLLPHTFIILLCIGCCISVHRRIPQLGE